MNKIRKMEIATTATWTCTFTPLHLNLWYYLDDASN